MLRNIVSTNATIDVDEDTSETLKALIDTEGDVVRETYSLDQIGQKIYQVRVVGYVDPATRETRWVMAYEDAVSVEYEDGVNLDEIERRYIEVVSEQLEQGYIPDRTDVSIGT